MTWRDRAKRRPKIEGTSNATACWKVAFEREAEAMASAAKQGRPDWRAYRCKFCEKWHLTKAVQRIRK